MEVSSRVHYRLVTREYEMCRITGPVDDEVHEVVAITLRVRALPLREPYTLPPRPYPLKLQGAVDALGGNEGSPRSAGTFRNISFRSDRMKENR